MAGDYTRRRIHYQDASMTQDFSFLATNLQLIPGKPNKTLYIQRIIVWILTSAADQITFEDNSSPTTVNVAVIPASPGANTRWDFDFGPEGKALGDAKALFMDMTAGNAGHVEVNAFYKPDAVMAVGSSN